MFKTVTHQPQAAQRNTSSTAMFIKALNLIRRWKLETAVEQHLVSWVAVGGGKAGTDVLKKRKGHAPSHGFVRHAQVHNPARNHHVEQLALLSKAHAPAYVARGCEEDIHGDGFGFGTRHFTPTWSALYAEPWQQAFSASLMSA